MNDTWLTSGNTSFKFGVDLQYHIEFTCFDFPQKIDGCIKDSHLVPLKECNERRRVYTTNDRKTQIICLASLARNEIQYEKQQDRSGTHSRNDSHNHCSTVPE